jgi:hypothetical protein
MKKEIKNAPATIEPIVCLSLSLQNIVASPPITAIAKETTEISSRTFLAPFQAQYPIMRIAIYDSRLLSFYAINK